MANAITTTHYTAAHLVRFKWTGPGPGIRYVRLCSHGAKSRVDEYYVPRIIHVSDIVSDNSGPSRLAVTLETQSPYQVFVDAGTDYWESFATLPDLLRAYPQMLYSAEVTMYLECSDVLNASQYHTLFVGRVLAPSYAGQISMTLECEQTAATDLKELPWQMITIEAMSGLGTVQIDKDNDGLPIPLCLGDWVPDLLSTPPPSWWMRSKMGALGLKLPMVSIPNAYKKAMVNAGGTYEWAQGSIYSETGLGLTIGAASSADTAYIDTGSHPALAYGTWEGADTVARSGVDEIFANGTDAYAMYGRERPAVFVPVIPKPIGVLATIGNSTKAVDGDLYTYATVSPGGASMVFELPSGSALGRICCNSTDSGTGAGNYEQYAPCGLKVAVLLVFPPGGVAPSGGATVRIRFCFPNGTTIYANAYNDFVPPTAGLTYVLCQVNIPYWRLGYTPGTAGAGWMGTKFHQWDFTTEPSSAAGPNRPLYDAAWDGQAFPFTIAVQNNEVTAPIYINAISLVVGCRLNTEAKTTEFVSIWRGYNKRRKQYIIDVIHATSSEMRRKYQRPEQGRFWTRGIGEGYAGTPHEDLPASSWMLCRRMFRDDASGTYTGTASAVLTDPIHYARFLLQGYGEIASSAIVTGAFGGYDRARSHLMKWWNSGSAAKNWKTNIVLASKMRVSDAIGAVSEHCMGLSVLRNPSGNYIFTHWFPALGLDALWFYSATPLDIGTYVLSEDQGPAIHFAQSDLNRIINNIEVRYGMGVRHVAKANAIGSDDGKGNAWGYGGVLPFANGMTASELCEYSATKFGERPIESINVEDTVEASDTAVMIGMYYLARMNTPERTLRMIVTPALYDMLPGMVFRLSNEMQNTYGLVPPLWKDGTTWESIYWMCTGNTQKIDRRITHEITAIAIPYTVGDEFVVGGMAGTGETGAASIADAE